jgi:hypothetical protein
MKVCICEACGTPFIPEHNEPLCGLCMRVIDEQTDLLLELYHFDPPDCE